MVSQGEGNTLAQCRFGDDIGLIENHRPVFFKLEVVFEHFSEAIDQSRLTMKNHRVFSRLGFDVIDANQTAAL